MLRALSNGHSCRKICTVPRVSRGGRLDHRIRASSNAPTVSATTNGIRRGIEELLHVAGQLDPEDVAARDRAAARKAEASAGTPEKSPAKRQPRKKTASAGTS